MSFQKYFPSLVWLYRTITGRLARRIYFAMFLLLLCATTVAHIRSVLMARKFHAVLSGLERVRVDQTTEAELMRTVPYMVRGHSAKRPDGSAETWYSVVISNESDWLMERLLFGCDREWLYEVADLLGYRYLTFSAGVIVLDGKVSSVRYAIANELVFPRQIGEIVSAKSVHGFWRPYRRGVPVTSADDEKPTISR